MLTLEQLRKKSEQRLSGLHPVFKQVMEKLIERCYARGVWVLITQGLRTYAEQDTLYAQGRTKPGKVVTKARGGYSNHNFGFAADFALLLRDGRTVSWDTLKDDDKDSLPDWSEVVEEAKKLGLEWGGDWRSFKDMPHLQMVFGLTTAQFRAGIRPTQAQLDTVLAKINKTGDEEMTVEEKAAFKELQSTVQKQDDRIKTLETAAKQPKVPAWAEQACINAKAAGVLDTANDGSYDFYRMVTLLDRTGIFNAKGDK
ncbi:peptidoglycan L-alanyl-D-glutamate endopeptidase CwlK [Paenibacillus brasilensis]|uniref:Peptidoglycan L-alanyl-D-glutamate endopeptidase CwlK n=2 Tax=Paenibacillus brasilensis TaxID=128574 RepID=A0ABU0L554_9BACL|nr:peptidoglycan L-alanyl-D-glutamate endopeptidase CwlK [Paenibacillus brasilensis]